MEPRMMSKILWVRGENIRAITRLLGVHENNTHYHQRRQREGVVDRPALRFRPTARFQTAFEHWIDSLNSGDPLTLRALHDCLNTEYDYPASLPQTAVFIWWS